MIRGIIFLAIAVTLLWLFFVVVWVIIKLLIAIGLIALAVIFIRGIIK